MFIVRLSVGHYIGNMGPTSYKDRAKQYKTSKGAKIALASYRSRRQYFTAKVVDLSVKLELVAQKD